MASSILVGDRARDQWQPGSASAPVVSSAPIGLEGFVFERHKLHADQLHDGELRHPLVFVQLSEPKELEWLWDGRQAVFC